MCPAVRARKTRCLSGYLCYQVLPLLYTETSYIYCIQ
jgi:hypothetical protein